MKSYFTKKQKQSVWSTFLASTIMFLCMSSCGEDEPAGQSINQSFKDQELLSYLSERYDLDGNGELSTEEAARVKTLEIDNSITNLEGLEYLTSLEQLNLSNNHIQHLDLTSFPHLKTLSLQGDSLQTLSLSSDNVLETLTCYNCPLLETSEEFYQQFGYISTLQCDSNFLQNVELDVFPKLHKLNYRGKAYFTLSNNQTLDTLYLYYPTGTSDLLSIKKAALTCLYTSNFRNIQIEACPNLADYSASINESHADFSNKVEIKDCPSLIKWESQNFEIISIENCEQLSELNIFCTENQTLQIKQANNLKKLTLRGDSYNIHSEDEISSIPNILFEDLPNLEYVTIKGNLTSMDLSKNLKLKEVYVENASLRFLNVANLPQLEKITCKNHRLNVLDASNCTLLDTCILQEYHLPPRVDQFPLGKAPLTLQSVKFEGCNNLKYLELGKSQLKSIDVSDTNLRVLDVRDLGETPGLGYSDRTLKEIKLNPDLEELYCQENVIESLDLSHTNITKLDVSDNELQYLKLNTQITKLLCNKNRLSSLDLSNCTQLDTLNISINNLKNLSLKDLSSLSFLETSQNPFEEIIIERCPNLQAVNLGSEQCMMIRLVDCTSLEHLSLSSANYTLENCPKINYLYLSDVSQEVLNMEEFSNLKTLYIQDCLAESILIGNLSQLNSVNISGNKNLQLLQTSNLPQLKKITVQDSPELPSITLPDSHIVESMRLVNLASLSSINLSSYPQLDDFYCRGCDLFTALDFTKNSLQLKADCRGNQSLQTIYANPNQNITKDDFTNIEYIY